MSGDRKQDSPATRQGSGPAHTPRSGSGADTALEALIEKRKLGTNGAENLPPPDETSGHVPKRD